MKNYTSTATDVFTVPSGAWGTYKASGTWTIPYSPSGTVTVSGTSPTFFVGDDIGVERQKILGDFIALGAGTYPMNVEDMEQLLELIGIYGEAEGKLRFILEHRP